MDGEYLDWLGRVGRGVVGNGGGGGTLGGELGMYRGGGRGLSSNTVLPAVVPSPLVWSRAGVLCLAAEVEMEVMD